jgi:hypothetical protein
VIIAYILIRIYLQYSETFKYYKLFFIYINKYVVQLHSIVRWHNCIFLFVGCSSGELRIALSLFLIGRAHPLLLLHDRHAPRRRRAPPFCCSSPTVALMLVHGRTPHKLVLVLGDSLRGLLLVFGNQRMCSSWSPTIRFTGRVASRLRRWPMSMVLPALIGRIADRHK